MKRKALLTNFNFWHRLINLWSVLFFFLIIYNFFNPASGGEILDLVSVIYIGALAIYVSNKEFERWYHKHDRQHPGEIFVIIWSILVVLLIVADLLSRGHYRMPGSVVSAYIAVLTILAITRKSKQAYQLRFAKKK
ncbi:MAG: hypothetical protein WC453_04215 [Patescibacteria group bacterium]